MKSNHKKHNHNKDYSSSCFSGDGGDAESDIISHFPSLASLDKHCFSNKTL